MKMRSVQIVGMVLGLSILTIGCVSNNIEDLNKNNQPSAEVSYSAEILPILQNNGCIGCHNNQSQSGQINLEGHARVSMVAKNNNLLVRSLRGDGVQRMPQGGAPLAETVIGVVDRWVKEGAKDN